MVPIMTTEKDEYTCNSLQSDNTTPQILLFPEDKCGCRRCRKRGERGRTGLAVTCPPFAATLANVQLREPCITKLLIARLAVEISGTFF
ncbi:hypothetical protein E2C01_034831 [Portunus trituberculatus]|uniref:Uncharacterized protein n=1 Tax=Portunus trituberculatus TaxID=210409 RepID=A0A5B7F824_PORTR|nr:hypothetical protein [Portunus trituberculatus]